MAALVRRAAALAPPEAHLAQACPGMAAAVLRHKPFPARFPHSKDPYRALIRAVAHQQLSGKAAATILARVLALFPDAPDPPPAALLAMPEERLRAAGLSRQKIAALRDIAAKRIEGVIPAPRAISHLPDEEIIARLTSVRGVGRWTVEMYLIFSLRRPDVLPVDDLGVRKGAERIVGQPMPPKVLAAYGKRWAPWRSAAAWHCWRATETPPP